MNDDPVRCARVLGQLMSRHTEDDFIRHVPRTCAYMAYEKFDDLGRGHMKGESIHHEEKEEEEEKVVATLVSA